MEYRNSHHNTTNESGQTLELFEQKARSLEDRVLEVYRGDPTEKVSAGEVFTYLDSISPVTPLLTSVRRAITNLMNKGHLVKTDRKVPGLHGRPEICYQLDTSRPPDLLRDERGGS